DPAMKAPRILAALDWWLVLIVALLGWIGVTFIGSATSSEHAVGFAGQELRQGTALVLAAALGGALLFVPYARVMRAAPLLYAAAVVALALVLVLGTVRNGSRRWLGPAAIQIQPSEFSKLAVIVALAAYLRLRSHA